MEIKIKNKYFVKTPKEYITSEEIGNLTTWLNNCEIFSVEDLREEIYDYILYYANINIFNPKEELEIVEDSEDVSIENIKELLGYFKYLIKESSCCDKQFGNYCSVCGEKLK